MFQATVSVGRTSDLHGQRGGVPEVRQHPRHGGDAVAAAEDDADDDDGGGGQGGGQDVVGVDIPVDAGVAGARRRSADGAGRVQRIVVGAEYVVLSASLDTHLGFAFF